MTRKNQILVILVLLTVLAMLQMVGDLPWCVDNYPVERLCHCLWYENNLFGQYITPGGF